MAIIAESTLQVNRGMALAAVVLESAAWSINIERQAEPASSKIERDRGSACDSQHAFPQPSTALTRTLK